MLRSFVASVLLLIFSLGVLAYSFIFGAFNTLFDKGFYSVDFADLSYEFLLAELPGNIDVGSIENFSDDDVRGIVESVFKSEDLSLILEDLYDQVVDSEVVGGEQLRLRIPLDWVHDRKDLLAQEITDILYERLGTCSVAEYQAINFSELPDCIPESFPKEDVRKIVGDALNDTVFADLPNDYLISLDPPEGLNGRLGKIFEDFFQTFSFIAGLSSILSLFLIGLLIFRPWSRVWKWELSALLVASVLVNVVMLVLYFSPNLLTGAYYVFDHGVSYEVFEYMTDVYNLFVKSLALKVLFYFIPLFFVALVLRLFVVFNKSHR